MAERRKKALDRLVKEFNESKRCKEELRRKLESYSTVKRWVYERGMNLKYNLKYAGMIFKEVTVKPAMIFAILVSFPATWIAAMTISIPTLKFIERYISAPGSVAICYFTLVSFAFSPVIILGVYYYHLVNKETKKRLKEEYGIAA